MAAGLEPTPQGAVMDQEDQLSRVIEDERRCGDMSGEDSTGVKVISVLDLAPENGMLFVGHAEGSDIIAQDCLDPMPKGWRIEAHR
jgi:hypothetical protein